MEPMLFIFLLEILLHALLLQMKQPMVVIFVIIHQIPNLKVMVQAMLWGSLGGVINVTQNTKITAESAPAETNNELRFYTANHDSTAAQLQMIIDASSGGVAIGTGYATNVTTSLDISDNSLIVEGKVGIGTNNPQTNLDINNNIFFDVSLNSDTTYTNIITGASAYDQATGNLRLKGGGEGSNNYIDINRFIIINIKNWSR